MITDNPDTRSLVATAREADATAIAISTAPRDLKGAHREAVRSRSKALFGNQDRLEVMVAIYLSSKGVFNATELQLQTPKIATNRVRAQLMALEESGLVAEENLKQIRTRDFARVKSALWDAAAAYYEGIRG